MFGDKIFFLEYPLSLIFVAAFLALGVLGYFLRGRYTVLLAFLYVAVFFGAVFVFAFYGASLGDLLILLLTALASHLAFIGKKHEEDGK